jgi:hypothetical protein
MVCRASLVDRDASELPSRTISSTFRGVRPIVTLPHAALSEETNFARQDLAAR